MKRLLEPSQILFKGPETQRGKPLAPEDCIGLFRQLLTTGEISELVDCADATAGSAVRSLVEFDILRPVEAGGRGRWMAHEVIEAVNSFTERAINPFGRH